jgi:hypothetical protein
MKKLTIKLIITVGIFIPLYGCNSLENHELDDFATAAITNVNLVPMTAEIILQDQTVLIREDRIIAIGDSDDVIVPPGVQAIDGEGAYLMPGLADMHVHIYEESRDDLPVSPLNLYIAKGVTTIRDCGTAPIGPNDTFVLDWRDEILSGETVGPLIYSSGRTIHGPLLNPGGVLAARYSKGFDFAKLYMELSVREFTEAQTKAEELGIYTVGHIPYQVGFELAISLGLDEIAHLEELSFDLMWFDNRPLSFLDQANWLSALLESVFDTYGYDMSTDIYFDSTAFLQVQGERLEQIINSLIAHDIGVGTTLATYETVDAKLFDRDAFVSREETAYLYPFLIEEVLAGQNRHQLMFQMLGENQKLWFWKTDLDIFLLKEFHRAGVMFVSGTDAGSQSIGVVEGFATHDDLRLLVRYGFTPYEALLTATVNAAHVVEKMGGNGNFGTIEVGNRADLILVSGNPLEDIQITDNILGVMVRGQWFSQEELEEMTSINEEE